MNILKCYIDKDITILYFNIRYLLIEKKTLPVVNSKL